MVLSSWQSRCESSFDDQDELYPPPFTRDFELGRNVSFEESTVSPVQG